MKKKGLWLLMVAVCCILVFGLSGCNRDKPLNPAVNGFEVQASITVTQGDTVTVETPEVTDENGNALDVYCDVVKNDEAETLVLEQQQGGSFTAEDVCGYKILYVVKSLDEQTVWRKTTVVNVTPTGGSETPVKADISVDDRYVNELVTVDEMVEIVPQVAPADTEITVSVKKDADASAVNVTAADGGKYVFTPVTAGIYTVTLAQKSDPTNSCVYSLFAQKAMKTNEVEVFDETWKDKEQFIGGKRADWETTDAKKNRYGETATLAYTTALSDGKVDLYVRVRGDKSYYQDLDAFDCVSMWVYVDGSKNATFTQRTAQGNVAVGATGTVMPRRWTEIRCPLKPVPTSEQRSFIDGMEYYADCAVPFAELNGLDENSIVYIDSVYAYKTTSISAKADATTAYYIDEQCDPSSLFNKEENMDLTYVLSRRSEIQTATETSFTFDKVDSFVVSAYPKNREYTGSASLVLHVDNRLVRLTGSDCSLSVSEIKGLNSASLPGVTVGAKKVAYENGERILSDTDSTATFDSSKQNVTFTGLTVGDYCLEFSDNGAVVCQWLVSYDATDAFAFFDTESEIELSGSGVTDASKKSTFDTDGFSAAGVTASGVFGKLTLQYTGNDFTARLPLAHGNSYYEQIKEGKRLQYCVFGVREQYTDANPHNTAWQMLQTADDTQRKDILRNKPYWFELSIAGTLPDGDYVPTIVDGKLCLKGNVAYIPTDQVANCAVTAYIGGFGLTTDEESSQKYADSTFYRLTGTNTSLTLSNDAATKLTADNYIVSVQSLKYRTNNSDWQITADPASVEEVSTKVQNNTLLIEGLDKKSSGDYLITVGAFGHDILELTLYYDKTDAYVFVDAATADNAYTYQQGSVVDADVTRLPGGATENASYVHYSVETNSARLGFGFTPVHGIKYYEQIKDTHVVKFQIYNQSKKSDGGDQNIFFANDVSLINTRGTASADIVGNPADNEWVDVTFSVGNLLAKPFENNDIATYYHTILLKWQEGAFFCSPYFGANFDMYVGNIRIVARNNA